MTDELVGERDRSAIQRCVRLARHLAIQHIKDDTLKETSVFGALISRIQSTLFAADQ